MTPVKFLLGGNYGFSLNIISANLINSPSLKNLLILLKKLMLLTSFVFKQLVKRPNKKSNFVEESLDVELNVIWIPGHLWNTNLESARSFFFF